EGMDDETAFDDLRRRLAGARADLERAVTGRQLAERHDLVEDAVRVRRPELLVLLGHLAEHEPFLAAHAAPTSGIRSPVRKAAPTGPSVCAWLVTPVSAARGRTCAPCSPPSRPAGG